MNEKYSSIPETKEHIINVENNIRIIINELLNRAINHDSSKMQEPELSIMDEYTPLLRESTYGSKEYFERMKDMKPALDHHYQNNKHHPEHFEHGIEDMNLIDLIEMFCDWLAATKRHANGCIYDSIKKNKERFKYNDLFEKILKNTANFLINNNKE